jgi:peptidoglycan L-alanyl-D-glutamate endopeptidase CwlK
LLHPILLAKVIQLLEACAKVGVLYHATHGTRTWKQQQALYDQGRTKPGKIVTNAKPGMSMHNYGLAVDLVFDTQPHRRGLFPNWDKKNYDLLAKKALALDLEAGHLWTSFQDSPHIQAPIRNFNLTIRDIRNKFEHLDKDYNAFWSWFSQETGW